MDVTSDEIRSSRFQGTRHVYDRREVDAFLHRTADTLEMYERKLAVTQSHVESLEKALDLATSRVRSVRERDARIGELEAALAAAQYNYEIELERAESRLELDRSGAASSEAVQRADEITAEARRQADQDRALAREYTEQASAEAADIRAAATRRAELLIEEAKSQEATMLKEMASARVAAEAALAHQIEARRAELNRELDEDADQRVRAAKLEMAAKVDQAENRAAKIASKSQKIIQKAEERAQAAETARSRLVKELELAQAALEAERSEAVDGERLVAEALAQIEVDREVAMREAQARLESAEGEREALLESARVEAEEISSAAQAEVDSIRRQAAQMRTALSALRGRFADASGEPDENFEVANALVDLDLHDLGEIVDLTDVDADPDEKGASDQEPLRVKSKWTRPGQVAPPGMAIDAAKAAVGTLADQAGANGEFRSTWRDKLAPASPESPPRRLKVVPEEPAAESLGFYERRLAGLRARLEEAMPDDT